jgi:hypothetical protein
MPDKTLVRAAHKAGPLPNGDDGCYSRWAKDGMCPGVQTAEWLNSLGEDDEKFGSTTKTNGKVRENWLKHDPHIRRNKGET